MQLDFVEVQAVHLLSEVVHFSFVQLLNLVVVFLKSTSLVHDLYAHVVTDLFVTVLHRIELASEHLDFLPALLELVQQLLEGILATGQDAGDQGGLPRVSKCGP